MIQNQHINFQCNIKEVTCDCLKNRQKVEVKMENKQVTNSDINVGTVEKEEMVMETNSEVTSVHDEIIDEVKRIITVSDDGSKKNVNDEILNPLFKSIHELTNSELLPAVEKLTDFETLSDELKKAGDILAKIIDYADKGFTLTNVSDEQQPLSEAHLQFSEILMIADTEIRQYIPTPANA